MLYEPKYIDSGKVRTYADIDLSMTPHPINRDITKKTGIEAIKQSIKNLVLINHYEKPFHPDIGCDVYKTLFENIELPGTKEQMEAFVEHVVNTYEPRAELNEVVVTPVPDNNGVSIDVWFTPLNTIEPVSVEIFLKILR